MEQKQNVHQATVAALVLFIALSLVLTWPLPRHLSDAVEDRQDALLNVWITAWDGHQLLGDPLHLFDANIFFPYPRTLAYSELLLGNALLALPLTLVSGNPVLGYNVALILSFTLSAFGTYLLVLKLTRSSAAGIMAGIIFAFCSYRMTNLAQAQLLTTQWLPLALLALHQLLDRPHPRHLASFVLFFCLQALSSFYYGVILALAVFGYWVWDIGCRIGSLAKHRVSNSQAPSSFVLGSGSSVIPLLLAFCLLLLLPFVRPYFQVQRDLGFERTLADSEPFSASLRQYLMVPPRSVLHGRWLPSDDTPIAGGYPVDALFPGLTALALALWGLIRGRDRTRWFFFLLLFSSFILSLGPRLYLSPGQPANLGFSLPYAWLYALVPGFKALRAPVRFDALIMLALAVLAGYGVQEAEGKRPRRRFLIFASCFLLFVAESLVWPAARAEKVPVGSAVPPVYRWLADQPSGPILELPMAFTPGGPQLDYQYLSTYHWHPTPDGYSGFIPPKHGQIVYEMEHFPSERSVSLLQALGVGYVVVHSDRYPADRWAEMQRVLAHVDDLMPVQSFGTDRVYQVRPRSFDPSSLEVGSYLPPRAAAGQPYTAYLIAANRAKGSYALPPTEAIRAVVTWEGGGGREAGRVSADVPLVTSPGGVAVIALPLTAPLPPGTYHLTINEQQGILGSWTITGTVEVGDQADNSFPIPARLEAWQIPVTARAGGPLPVSLTWRAVGKIDAYYSIYVKLLDAKGNAVAGWDGQPRNGQAPTLLWMPGEAIDDLITLSVPADLSPGDYTVEVGMYRAQDLARCLTLNAGDRPLDRVELGMVRIEP